MDAGYVRSQDAARGPNRRPPRIAFYETSIHGHRGAYLVAVCAEAVRRGWDVTVVTGARDLAHPYFSQIRRLVGDANLVFAPFHVPFPHKTSAPAMLRYHFEQWAAARRCLLSSGRAFDFVYALNIDYMDKAIQVLGVPSRPVPMSGMTMRIRFHLDRLGIERYGAPMRLLGSWSFSQLLRIRGLSSVTTADPSLREYCEQQSAPRYRKLLYVPEIGMEPPTVSAAQARRSFGFDTQDRVILIFGSIDRRKAYEELIEATAAAADTTRVRILIVGKAEDEAHQALEGPRYEQLRRRGVLTTRLGFADDDMQSRAFAASDLVWIAYRNHSTMSGVFSQAMASARPVIAPNYGLLSWLARQYDVGITVDIDDAAATGAHIAGLLQDRSKLDALRHNASTLSKRHSPRNFGSAICNAIGAGLTRRGWRLALEAPLDGVALGGIR